MHHTIINGIGLAAAVCSIASFVPQVIKLLREKDAEGVSLRMYAVTVTGFALWTLYGFFLHSIPLMLANAISLGLSATILILTMRYAKPASR